MLFVVGEAGIGKSRLVQETVAVARERRFRVLCGRATIPHSTVAFRPLTEALFSYFRDQGPPDIAELEPFRPALARLVPEWRRADAMGVDDSVIVLAEAIVRLLRVLGRDGGCLLVLEDLHWADPETLSIVEYLAENLASESVTCVCTVRSEEAGPALKLAHALAARRAAPTIELSRLEPSDITAMASACLSSIDVPDSVEAMLSASADGLPFFVEELLAGAVGSGALTRADGGWSVAGALVPDIPHTFLDSVETRLNALGDAAEVIVAAAVLGRTFDWTLLPAITKLDDATILHALRGAAEAQIVVTDVAGGGSFRFRHALDPRRGNRSVAADGVGGAGVTRPGRNRGRASGPAGRLVRSRGAARRTRRRSRPRRRVADRVRTPLAGPRRAGERRGCARACPCARR